MCSARNVYLQVTGKLKEEPSAVSAGRLQRRVNGWAEYNWGSLHGMRASFLERQRPAEERPCSKLQSTDGG